MDEEPFAVIVNSTGAHHSGMFLHHGNWPNRTQKAPQAFWDHVKESGVGNYFLTNPPSGASSGTLENLPHGQQAAFDSIVSRLRSSSTG